MKIDPIICLALRAAFALLFSMAFLHKVFEGRQFQVVLRQYLGGSGFRYLNLKFVGISIVAAEALVAGAGILFAVPNFHFAVMTLLPLSAYTAGMWINLRRGNLLLDCGCNWGSQRRPVTYALVVRNVILCLSVLLLMLPMSLRILGAMDYISIAAMTITISLLYAAIDVLLSTRSILQVSHEY